MAPNAQPTAHYVSPSSPLLSVLLQLCQHMALLVKQTQISLSLVQPHVAYGKKLNSRSKKTARPFARTANPNGVAFSNLCEQLKLQVPQTLWEEEKWVKGLTVAFQRLATLAKWKTTLNNYNAHAEWNIAKISANCEGKQYGKYVNNTQEEREREDERGVERESKR